MISMHLKFENNCFILLHLMYTNFNLLQHKEKFDSMSKYVKIVMDLTK